MWFASGSPEATSNCIVNGAVYRVCCVNECEVLLDDIERSVAAATARPEALLAVVGNLSHASVDDEPPAIDEALRAQLRQISETHGGAVPIHGRLFAQWLRLGARARAHLLRKGMGVSGSAGSPSWKGHRRPMLASPERGLESGARVVQTRCSDLETDRGPKTPRPREDHRRQHRGSAHRKRGGATSWCRGEGVACPGSKRIRSCSPKRTLHNARAH